MQIATIARSKNTDSPIKENQRRISTAQTKYTNKENQYCVRFRPASGTSRSDNLYPWLYQSGKAVAYIGGGNLKSLKALNRVEVVEGWIKFKLIADLPLEEVRRLVHILKKSL